MMDAGKTRSGFFRGVRAAALLALAPFAASVSHAVSNAAVVSVQPTRVADLVLLSHGFNAGLRQGMICQIRRGATDIADVVLVELRPSCSAALIVSVAPNQSIRAGDIAAIKVLKS